jgi:hypothetical protein
MIQTKTLAVIAGVLCCALLQAAQAGDVYKYVDERGNTLYTDKPIPGAVLVSTGTQRPPEVAQRMQATAQAAQTTQLNASNQRIAQQQSNSQAAAAVSRDLESSRAERCEKAKAFYQNTIDSQRLYRTKADGTREYLSDQELAQARVDALQARNAICGTSG